MTLKLWSHPQLLGTLASFSGCDVLVYYSTHIFC